MQLPKPSRLMSDQELCEWTIDLIRRRAPESDFLDYKEWSGITQRTERIEAAKDISSFANERGGLVIYGVPEQSDGAVPIPADLSTCGIASLDCSPADLENVLLDTVMPPLPEIDIRLLTPNELGSKTLLLVHHPASWDRPHMVQGYEQGRYYRRGNYRNVLMKEQEVETAYRSRLAKVYAAEDFFNSARMVGLPNPLRHKTLRVSLAPTYPINKKHLFHDPDFRTWLDANHPGGRRGAWAPFVDGVRYVAYSPGVIAGKAFDFRVFHNGAISFTAQATDALVTEDRFKIEPALEVIKQFVLLPAKEFLIRLSIPGPLVIQVKLMGMRTLEPLLREGEREWRIDLGIGRPILGDNDLSFIEETSSTEILTNDAAVLKRISDRVHSSFGLWRD